MDKIGIRNGTLILPDRLVQNGTVLIEGSKITRVGSEVDLPRSPELTWIDARGYLVCPGLIEMHTNGAMGVDFLDASLEDVKKISLFQAQHGVTSYLATLCTASPSKTLQAAQVLREAAESNVSGASLLGIHLEGPYLNPLFRRVHPAEHVRIYTQHELDEILETSGDKIKLFTLAPEMPGGLAFISYLKEKNIIPAMGHSNATYEEAQLAIEAGVRYATHVFAAMRPFHHRQPGIVGASLLDDRVWVEALTDGLHLHPAAAKLLWKTKGLERMLVATDAMAGAGLLDGEYLLAGQRVSVKDGRTISPEGKIAGGIGVMNLAVRNAYHWLGIPVHDAVTLGSYNPASVLGLENRKGSLESGKDADLFLCDNEFNPVMSIVMGKIVHRI
jgi:N-acetylglucosamine-6-phosphate deacetylase